MKKPTAKKNNSGSIQLVPLSLAQSYYITSIEEKVVSVGMGFAGSGKTYIAATKAAQFKIDNRKEGKIILCRPNVSDSRSIGYLKGTLEEKMESWVVPYMDVLKRHLNGKVEEYVANETIQVVPFEYMQGRTWDNSFIMLDEAQHTSPKEMEMFLKRIGTGSTVVITGDLDQSAKGQSSGLKSLLDMQTRVKYIQEFIGITEFKDPDDIVRSDFCRIITKAYSEV